VGVHRGTLQGMQERTRFRRGGRHKRRRSNADGQAGVAEGSSFEKTREKIREKSREECGGTASRNWGLKITGGGTKLSVG